MCMRPCFLMGQNFFSRKSFCLKHVVLLIRWLFKRKRPLQLNYIIHIVWFLSFILDNLKFFRVFFVVRIKQNELQLAIVQCLFSIVKPEQCLMLIHSHRCVPIIHETVIRSPFFLSFYFFIFYFVWQKCYFREEKILNWYNALFIIFYHII